MHSQKANLRRLQTIDSHTAGEPTRVVVAGGPDLGRGNMQSRLQFLRQRFDGLRRSVVLEPRGSEVVVGALLCDPEDKAYAAGVIFFNDVGYLGMCGHGTIGLVTTLAHLGRIGPGTHKIETPVGVVSVELHQDGRCSVENVPSYRFREAVQVHVPGYGDFTGDIAWGGNWFFLVTVLDGSLHISNRTTLVGLTMALRAALKTAGIKGKNGALIDHIELSSSAIDPANSGRNFVLCPGTSFDRSPCGTGTSAKLACLFADGKLQPNDEWRQEGILGTVFTGKVRPMGDHVVPIITGRAWITAETTLIFDDSDPFSEGIQF